MFVLDKNQTHRVRAHISARALPLCVLAFVFATSSYAQAPTAGSADTTTPRIAVTLPSSPMSAATAAEIQKINENMTVLQAQYNQLELKAKIAAKQREIGAQAGGDALSSFGSKNGNPSVVSVAGLKGILEAVLVFPGGVTQRVKTGDVIDDRRVAKVAINEVVLTDLKGKTVQRLAFGTSATMREATPSTQNTGSMPFPPGMPAPTVR
jgi:type IV pilus biogenesis protein PilP